VFPRTSFVTSSSDLPMEVMVFSLTKEQISLKGSYLDGVFDPMWTSRIPSTTPTDRSGFTQRSASTRTPVAASLHTPIPWPPVTKVNTAPHTPVTTASNRRSIHKEHLVGASA